MLSPLVVLYVGDDRGGLDMLQLLDQQLNRPAHVLATRRDDLPEMLGDERVDCVVCGPDLPGTELQKTLFVLSDNGADVPVFDLGGTAVDVPGPVELHQFDPEQAQTDVADEILGVVLDSRLEHGEWDDRPVSISRGLGQYFAVDERWRVTEWDPRLVSLTGVEPSTIVGRKLWEALPNWEGSVFAETCQQVMASREPTTTELYHGPAECWLVVRVLPTPSGGIECFLRDITEHKETAIEGTSGFESTLDRITDAFFALDNRERFVFLNSQAEFLLDVEAEAVEGERFWDEFPAAVSTTFYREFKEAMETQRGTSFEEYYRPLDRWFEVNAYPSEDGLSVFLRDVTEQVQLQQKLEQLHEVARELIVAESDVDIAAGTVEAAEEVLGFPLVAVWRYNRSTDLLDPLAWSPTIESRVEGMGPLGPDSRFIWAVYETGEHRHLGFVPATTSTSHHPGKVTSELLVPVGEYGVLGAYSEERDAFDETDVELFRLLASTVESAFARTEREREIAQRNERLDEFASVVSHDLRNPLNVASAHTELARGAEDDAEHLDRIDEALERMERLIEDLLARARGDRELEREPLELAAVAEDAWESVDAAEATLSVPGTVTVDADVDRLTQLFENLFRNAVEHGGPDVSVLVDTCEGGFFVADNGPGIPAEKRAEVFKQGVTGSETGTGYGLSIVTDIVEGHGWGIEVGESDAGGARFEVTGIRSMSASPTPDD
jgi:signal transduction histidine kinase